MNYNIKKRMDRCKSVLTIPQFTGTCWFNALLMTLLYSDGSREYLIRNLINSELFLKNRELYTIFMDILENKHRKINDNDAVFFNALKPENILKLLHNADKEKFYFDPDKYEGHWGEYYLIRLFEYFGMKKNVVYMYRDEYYPNSYFYSPLNNKPHISIESVFEDGEKTERERVALAFARVVKKINKNPDMIVVTQKDAPDITAHKDLLKPPITLESEEIQEVIRFHDSIYKIDSLLISNFNFNTCTRSHQIAGVTCDNKRYMYNGWIRETKDPAKSKKKKKRFK